MNSRRFPEIRIGKLMGSLKRRGLSAVAVPSTVVECLVRDEGVAGSNPATPTIFSSRITKTYCFRQFALCGEGDSYGDRLHIIIGDAASRRLGPSSKDGHLLPLKA